MKTEEELMQEFIERALDKDNRERVDYRVFDRKTGAFYENTPEMMLSLAGKDILQVNGKFVASDEIVIQRYIGAKDRNGKKIYEGDFLLTNEGNWRGFVVFYDGLFGIVDPQGGYSAEPEWERCEIISNICEMNGNTQKYLCNRKEEKECQQQDSSPIVKFMNLPF